MKKLTFTIILFIIIKVSIGQGNFECYTPEDPYEKSATCNDWNNYSAVDPNNTPIKTVRITFHILQKANFTGNFPDNSTSRNWLSVNLMNAINGRMGSLQSMNLPTSSPTIADCRIRFTLANIYFWQNDIDWSFQISDSYGDNLYTKYVTNQAGVANKTNSIHIFMSENDTNRHGRANNFGSKDWITASRIYSGYLISDTYGTASLISHELGHAMGLHHT